MGKERDKQTEIMRKQMQAQSIKDHKMKNSISKSIKSISYVLMSNCIKQYHDNSIGQII